MEEKTKRPSRYKLLAEFYKGDSELKTSADRIRRYREEHYSDDPLKIVGHNPFAPPVNADGLVAWPEDKVVRIPIEYEGEYSVPERHNTEIKKSEDGTKTTVMTKQYNLFRDVFPKKDCPKCGKAKAMQVKPLCGGCKESEGGKFKTYWHCLKCGHKIMSEAGVIQQWKELGGGEEFYANLPDGQGFIPKISLDPDRKEGD